MCECRIKLVKVINPDQPQPPSQSTEEKQVQKKNKKERFGYRLKRLKNLALANGNDEEVEGVSEGPPHLTDGVVDGGANPQPVLMARTENFVHNPFEQNQEVKVNGIYSGIILILGYV